jgi:L-alanine-DL-glutamate epimerase-like enolase superfamily enzyme
MAEQIERTLGAHPDLDRQSLQAVLPAGGARNALDCAFWAIEAQRQGVPVWQLCGIAEAVPVRTTFTIGVTDIDRTVAAATAYGQARALKLKLAGDGDDAARIRAVRLARPTVWLGVDANQALDLASLASLAPTMVECGVALVEQPLPIGREQELRGIDFPIPLAADESFQCLADLERMAGLFQVVNIKLDKCGGLTEALRIVDAAGQFGIAVMAGTMITTSLGLAPAFILAQLCDIADLDGPVFLSEDRADPARYRDGCVEVPLALWGGA